MMAPIDPINIAVIGPGVKGSAVIATSPANAPLRVWTISGLPYQNHVVNNAPTAPAAADRLVNKTMVVAATVSSPENGLITVSLGSTITVNMKPGRYVYDVKIISSGGKEYKAIEGSALVRGGVTR